MKIFSIEMTNNCNARCEFCPHSTSKHTRPRGYVSDEVVDRVIALQTAATIAICGFGEPTMHPLLPKHARAMCDAGMKVMMNTNGSLLTQRMYDDLAPSLTRLVVVADYYAFDADKILQSPKLPIEVFTITGQNVHAVQKEKDNWGGQYGPSTRPKVSRCSFCEDDWVYVTWEGVVSRCCADFNVKTPIGTVWDCNKETSLRGIAIPLCKGCNGYVFKDTLVVGDYDGTKKGTT